MNTLVEFPPVPFTVRLVRKIAKNNLINTEQLYTVVEVQNVARQNTFRLLELQKGIFLDADIFILYLANNPN